MGKRNPSPEAGMELGGRGAFPLPLLAHTAKSASVMCQMACRCKAGQFQQPPSLPPHALTWKAVPSSLRAPGSFLAWEYSTAGAGE